MQNNPIITMNIRVYKSFFFAGLMALGCVELMAQHPIFDAIHHKDLARIQEYCRREPGILNRVYSDRGETPLYAALFVPSQESVEIATWMLRIDGGNADVNRRNLFEGTAVGHTALEQMVISESENTLRAIAMLIRNGADPDLPGAHDGFTARQLAMMNLTDAEDPSTLQAIEAALREREQLAQQRQAQRQVVVHMAQPIRVQPLLPQPGHLDRALQRQLNRALNPTPSIPSALFGVSSF